MDDDFKQQINELNRLSFIEFLKYFKGLDKNKQNELINNPDLVNFSNENFRALFFNLDNEQAINLLNNEVLYDKVFSLPGNGKRSILDVLEKSKPEFLKLLLENQFSKNYGEIIIEYLKELEYDKFKKLNLGINLDDIIINHIDYNNKDILYKFLNNKFELQKDSNFMDIFNMLVNKLANKKLNPAYLVKINNYKELILYAKFNVLVKVDADLQEITLHNGLVLPNDEIIKIKDNKITKLIELLENITTSKDDELLEVSTKLYFVFGFDNAKKIIENKFSGMTDSALIKISDFNYKDERREYRAKNQNKFYYHGMVQVVLDSLINGSNTIFEVLTYYGSIEEVIQVRREFSELLVKFNNESDLKKAIREKLKEKIYLREQQYKNKTYDNFNNKYIDRNKVKMNTGILLKLLKDINLAKVVTYESATLTELQNFLLGNTKYNNDCLFRLIVNQEAAGLNKNLFQLINNFKLIQSIAEKGNLSLNSVLDLIDILKINLYHLNPNERDITLETLTKIINSTEFCNGSTADIIREACKLHLKRKEKVYASIPTAKGKTSEYSYEVAPFDAEYLLSSGCDSKNCFKISGKGEELFRYCLTSNQAAVIYITGKNKTYICPIVRSGNIVNCNNIDPIVEKGEEEAVLDALKQCLNKIMELSSIHENHEENIEIATLTNWHLEKFFDISSYDKIVIDKYIPIDTVCYNDFNKAEITNYVLLKKPTFNEIEYYLSNDRFYQERTPNYEFDISNEYDKEKLALIVNSIYYTSIDYQPLSEKEKNAKKREFKNLDVSKFQYIIGNKDWYVAIDDQFNVLANILPYDFRAKKDYFEALAKMPTILEQMMEENNYDRENLRKAR